MSKIKKLQSVRGMNDRLPPASILWEEVESLLRSILRNHGYQPIDTPIVEPTALFKRAIGAVTDIVEKEMYSFVDTLNGEELTLRPEGTAGCVRAVIEHNLTHQPGRFYYVGQMFRHERPQQGRYRQFHQFGAEAFGYEGPDIDAEMIAIGNRIRYTLGLQRRIDLQINCLGEADERQAHRAALIAYFEQHEAALDDDAKRRLYTNPLRILDSKNPAMQKICNEAPVLLDYLGQASRDYFEELQNRLDELEILYDINPRLVRGLDYYNRCVFEWVANGAGAQSTVGAGGRYDGLVEQLGGKPTPACGFAFGMERLIALCVEENIVFDSGDLPSFYLVYQGEDTYAYAYAIAEDLRDKGLQATLHCGGGNFKTQMKKADQSGADCALIIGEDEVKSEQVQVKPLRGQGPQSAMLVDDFYTWLEENFLSETKNNLSNIEE